ALGDKIICDLDKTTDFSQRSLQNCPKIIQDSFEPSNDNSNIANAPREPFVVNQDPCKDSSQRPLQINHHCCYGCGDPLEGIFCHQCTCKLCGNGAHYGYNCPPKVSVIPDPESFTNQTIKELLPTVQNVDPKSDLVHKSPNVFNPPSQLPFISCEFCGNDACYGHYCTRQQYTINHPVLTVQNELFDSQNKLMEQLISMCDMIPACYDDDDDYNFAIIPTEPVNSLSMGEEHPDTILAMESDEFIKSSVENLVPIPSESEGESEYDVPVHEEFTTFLNILFDVEYEFDSSDDQSSSNEDVPEKIFSNPLFEQDITPMKRDQLHYNAESGLIESLRTHDSLIIISSKIDSLLDEFVGELTLLKSIPPGIDKTDYFVSKNSDIEIKSFSLSLIPVEDSDSLMEEINLSFTLDYPMPSGIEDDDYESERDILMLKDLLSNDTLSLPEIELFHFDIPSFSHDYASERDILILEDFLSNDSLSLPENESFHFDIPSFSRPPANHHMLKDDKEKDKIRTKLDKIESKREAWKSPTKSKPSHSQESNKEKKIQTKGTKTELIPSFDLILRAFVSLEHDLAEDVFVKVGKFHYTTDFVVVDYDVDPRVPLILGRPFLRTTRALIDVHGEELTLRVNDEAITFKVEHTSRYSHSLTSGNPTPLDPIIAISSSSFTPFEGSDFILEEIETFLRTPDELSTLDDDFDPVGDIALIEKLLNEDPPLNLPSMKNEEHFFPPSIKEPPELELKDLPPHLEYALEGTDKLPLIISKELKDEENAALLKVLKSHKRAIAWKISDIKGIDPRFCTYKILMKDDFKPTVQLQRRVNLKIHEVIKKEVIKLFDAGLIYPIFDSPWVSPVHYAPKKGGMTVVTNEDNELIPTRLVTRWRVYIDYPKLNDATRKDHFLLLFIDQMLERLAGNEYCCFLDGFSGYFYIPIDPQDQ
nr:reverse transcriptase domain-containing protein [Tanacetum cinerariifolium]